MKKTTIIILAGVSMFAALQLSSCKKDSGSSANLVGIWNEISFREYTTDSSGKVLIDSTFPESKYQIIFKALSFDQIKISSSTPPCDTCATYETQGKNLYIKWKDGSKDTLNYELSNNNNSLLIEYPKDIRIVGGATYYDCYSEKYIRQ